MEINKKIQNRSAKIGVIGLGYVGLPISLTISKNYETLGYDINKIRISQLRKNIDNNNII